MNAKRQLERLVRIQELALAMQEAQKVVDEAPTRLEEIEAHFRERNAEYVAVRDQLEEVDLDQRTRSGELSTLETQRDKYKAALMEVKNQREYAAMLKEIDVVTAEIAGHEEAILQDMEALEKLREELKTHEDHIKAEREIVERDSAKVKSEAATAEKELRRLTDERASIESELPASIRATVEKLEARRHGIFLSKADNGTCMSCFVRVRPQMFQEVKLATKVHTCGNCRRFLYFEPAFKADPPKPAEAAVDEVKEVKEAKEPKEVKESKDVGEGGVSGAATSEAQTVNGGAV